MYNYKIYGHPYNPYKYYFYDTNNIDDLFKSFKYDYVKIMKYIDGLFAINIQNNDFNIWITDAFGMFPLFYNTKNYKICVDIDYLNNNINNEFINTSNYESYYTSTIPKSVDIYNKELDKFNITAFTNYKILKNGCIYIFYDNKLLLKYNYINTILYNDKLKTEDIFIELIKNLSKDKKILVPLSSGMDTRAIYSIIDSVYDNYDVYTYGNEKKFVYNNITQNNILIDMDEINYDEIINSYILSLNGMSDIYLKSHLLKTSEKFSDYDIIFTGEGSNEYYTNVNNYFLYNNIFLTGMGHIYKYLSKKIIYVPIFMNKRLYNSFYYNKNNRVELIKKIINKTNIRLNDIPFNPIKFNSIFNHNLNFNTKYNYIKKYFEKINNLKRGK